MKFSHLSWDWGIANFFLDNVPFDYSTSPLFAQRITQFLLPLMPQNKAVNHIFEVGGGNGMLAKHILDTIEEQYPEIYSKLHLHVSEYAQEQVREINQFGFLDGHTAHVDFTQMDAQDPDFPDPPSAIYMSYLVAALPVRQIEVEDEQLYELQVQTEIADDATLTDSTVFPPKILNAEEIKTLLKEGSNEKLRLLAPRILPLLKETLQRIPIQKSNIPSSEIEWIRQFSRTLGEGIHRFNVPYRFIKALEKMVYALEEEGLILIHDFGFNHTKDVPREALLGKYGVGTYYSCNFAIIKHVCEQLGCIVAHTQRKEGESQVMAIQKSANRLRLNTLFKRIFQTSFYSVPNILDKIWDDNAPEITPELAEEWVSSLPELEQESYALNTHIASGLMRHDHLEIAKYYVQRSLKRYGPIAIPSFLLLGQIYKRQDKPNLSETQFKRVLSICPTFPQAHKELGILYAKQKLWDDYITHTKNYLKYSGEGDVWQTLITMAIVHIENQEKEAGLALLDHMLSVHQQYPDTLQENQIHIIQKIITTCQKS